MPGSSEGRIHAVTMPRWGMTMTEGKVTRWLVPEGRAVEAGMDLAEIETTKITNVFEAAVTGTLARVIVGAGSSAAVGAVIAVIAQAGVTAPEIDAFLATQMGSADTENESEAAAGPSSRMVEAGDHRLHVLSLGQNTGTPIIFLHGFGGDLNSWLFNQPAAAQDRAAHALDLPGHGQSPLSAGKGSARAMSQAVLALMDALGLSRAHLVGHSMGGAVALLLAISAPARVASVTGIAPGGLGPELNRAFIDGFIAADRRPPMTEALGLLFADSAAVSRTMVDNALRDKRLDGAVDALKAIAAANFTPDGQKSGLGELLPSIKAPVQIIWGRQDKVIPVTQVDRLPKTIAVTVLDGAGHMPHMEKSAEVNRLIASFTQLAD